MFHANRTSAGVDTGGRGRGAVPESPPPLDTPALNSGGPAYGPSANPAAGAAGFNNPNAPVGPNTPPPPVTPPQTNAFGSSGWKPEFEQQGGYNSSQYASTGTANQLAQALGARVNQTQNAPGSPIGPPPQAMLDFGGDGQLNAGLMAERYAKYDRATADAMTRAELAYMSPRQNPNEDSQGGSMGSWSMYGPRQGGENFMGQGSNMGQYIGENPGGSFGSQPANAGAVRAPLGPQTGGGYQGPPTNYHPQSPAPYPAPYAPQPQFGNRMNYGGFGGAQQFGQANQNAGMQQLMQLLLGGQGGTLQQRGRANQFGGGGQMAGMLGMPSFLSRNNQSSGNQFNGPGRSPFAQSGNMSGLANFMNRFSG